MCVLGCGRHRSECHPPRGDPAIRVRGGHLNPVIAKLAAGRTVFGLMTGDLSEGYS